MLLRDVEVGGHRADVRTEGDRVTEIGRPLPRRPGEPVLDGGGGALLPGLHDHHLHLHALAAERRSLRCRDRAALAAALPAAAPDAHGWLRATGLADDLDAAALDRLEPHRPLRVQHRSGALWMLNTPAIAATGLVNADHPGIERDPAGNPTGRLWRADAWLRTRLPPPPPLDLPGLGRDLLRLGITGLTDATPDLDPASLDGVPQHVHSLGAAGTGERITIGPRKIVLADSALPSLDDLAARIAAEHAHGRCVAVHCVTREALFLLLAAFDTAGVRPGDRIEHAALVPADTITDLARRGLRVVTQPGFLADRGDDYLRDVPAEDHPDLYRCRSLLNAAVPLALSSDAPYGPVDPWQVMRAAVHRRTPHGDIAGPAERLTPRQALDAYLGAPGTPGGPPRRVRPGTHADLIVLRLPLAEALHDLDAAHIATVLLDGEPVNTA
ncbi:amidohydrolase family protein [Spirillospora sp. NPDC029432]|uniref:amidohydrolase family protein n=1 Tax=Spirillospora sp. NPDC029432 TaxID=3154599 RepID=UPI003453E2E8